MDGRLRTIVSVLQTVAITASALYTGFTFAYSHVVIPPMTTHASPKILARQWLQAYQVAPVFVAPLIILAIFSNATLAYLAATQCPRASLLYMVAAVANVSIIPYTALYMEPGINGAGKWKAQEILRAEGFGLKGVGAGTDKDTANEHAKRWAEKVDMKTIAETWARTNAWRYVITSIAVLFSASATVVRG